MRRPHLPKWPAWSWRPRWHRTPKVRVSVDRGQRTGSVRVLGVCYAVMAVVTVVATGVGFWLSYAGLHTFAVHAGLTGPEAWAWPSSVDLFILAGELGITISTLRDQRHDWRAWLYFAMGAGPSVMFNVLHVFPHALAWGRYAVAATPPLAAVLALAALMQQVTSLPDALRQFRAQHADDAPDAVPSPVPNATEVAAEASLRATLAAGNPWSVNALVTNFRLTRPEATKLRTRVLAEANGHAPQDPDTDTIPEGK